MASTADSAIAGPSQTKVETNSRGIPHAPFISNVQEYLGGPDEDVEPTLRKFQETMSKYKFMELNTAQRRSGLEDKIPDIRKTLQMVQFLESKKGNDTDDPIETTFELNDTLYAKAKVDPVDKVHLWLGANVMLEYPLDEAISLLTNKLSGAEKSLVAAKEDLDFLREQITIMEVNTARVHNWDVKRRRERREQLEREGISESDPSVKASSWLHDDRGADGGNDIQKQSIDAESSSSDTAKYLGDDKPADANLDTITSSALRKEIESIPESSTEAGAAADTASRDGILVTHGNSPDVMQPPTQPPTKSLPISDGDGQNKPAPPTSTDTDTDTVAQTSTTASATSAATGATAAASATTPLPTSTTQTAEVGTDVLQSTAIVVPPLNFNMVSRGIYRSGHPNERNFEFMRRLNLKSIMYLGNEDYRSNVVGWARGEGISIFHFRLAINKEPMAEMDGTDVTAALNVILNRANSPILIHCNKGKYRVGCLVGLLRRLQGWSHTSIFEEYSRFAGTKISDLEFIEVFDLSRVSIAP
ncbi:hypothetical protein BCV70DRAFT_202145 [Testicularia cyperi]|uniref:Prefoldin subunit 3 n=1 Tax=Testicularia cyperi TaxID=1882483 RepID=A0A317XKI0_9BASI|nr:hypothetical protein BCV70DRAFT_202145 [Testicularia cyperi]